MEDDRCEVRRGHRAARIKAGFVSGLTMGVILLAAGNDASAQATFVPTRWGSLSPSADWQIFSGQLTGSALPDLVGYESASGALVVVENDGVGFQNASTPWITLSPGAGWRLGLGEFTGDSLDDVVGYLPSNGSVWVFRNDGTSFSSEARGGIIASADVSIYPGDFDGDGLMDIALYDAATGSIHVGISDGSSFSFTSWFTMGPTGGWTLASGEFTGDSRADLAGYHTSTGVVWLGTSTGSAFSFAPTTATLSPTTGWRLLGAAFDALPRDDLFAYHEPGGTLWVGLNTGSDFDYSGGAWTQTALVPKSGWLFAPGDFDGDGPLEVAGYHTGNGSLWLLLHVGTPPLGYAWPLSGAPGDAIDFMVSGGWDPLVEFYRHTSVGSTVDSDLMGTTSFIPVVQSCAANANRFGCGWATSFSLTIPASWPSGMYSARIRSSVGADYDITFVVKPRPTATRTIAVLANVNTWNAYNDWGGGSKYEGVERGSFLRPNPYSAPLGEGHIHHHLTRAELWMLGWLEAEGYDPHLFTDIDFHNGEVGTQYDHLVLSAHPEYFTVEMYDALEDHLVAGGSLLYVAGNGIYERTTYDNGTRELIFLGGVTNGPRELELFRRLPGRAERRLLGVATERCSAAPLPFTVLNAAHAIFAGTGVANGTTFGNSSFNIGGGSYLPSGASAWEVDTSAGPGATGGGCSSLTQPIPPSTLPAGLQVIARAVNPIVPSAPGGEVVYYDHPSGGHVLSIGSLTASGSLVLDPVLQQMARNALGETGDCPDANEVNDSLEAARGPLASGSETEGRICTAVDFDWFLIDVPTAGTIGLSLVIPDISDFDLDLYNSAGELVDRSDNASNGQTEIINYQAVAGTFYVRVDAYDGIYNQFESYFLSYNFRQCSIDSECDDGISCTTDRCNSESSLCEFTPDHGVCNDDMFCTGDAACDLTQGCMQGPPPICNDGIECTVDSCNEATNSCDFRPSGSLCDDGVPCTVDTCNPESGDCEYAANHDVCDDGLFCTGVASCDIVQGCVQGNPPQCKDDVACTIDSCDEETRSCVSEPDDSRCDDGLICGDNGCAGCGDGVTDLTEECDDGNILDGDGCSAGCIKEYCGDRIVQNGLGEQCDDGNAANDDSCTENCLLHRCGDDIVGPDEKCDDGNTVGEDGCSSVCEFDVNNGPSVAQLVEPMPDATGLSVPVKFVWNASSDPNGDALTYELLVCEFQDFSGCNPILVDASRILYRYAGLGGPGHGPTLAGFFLLCALCTTMRPRKAQQGVITAAFVLVSLGFVLGCGNSGGQGPPPSISQAVAGLSSETTYYWKVTASDGVHSAESETRTFTTQ